MLFMPVDLFKPYVQGQQQAVKDNWTDLFNSEKLRQDFVKTDTDEATEGGNVFATNARNQYSGDTFNRQNALGAAAQGGKLATTQLASDAQQSATDYLRDQNYPSQYGSTMGARTISNLGVTGLGTTQQDATVAALQPNAQQMGANAAQDIFNKSQYGVNASSFSLAQQPVVQQAQAATNAGRSQLAPLQTAYDTAKLTEGTQALTGSGAVGAANNQLALSNDQGVQRAQMVQQNATQIASMMAFRGDSSTPENALALQRQTDSSTAWLRGQGLLEANQQIVYPPGQEPVINTYNPDGSILSTVPAVQTFDRWAAYTPLATATGTRAGTRAQKTPAVNPLVGGAPGGAPGVVPASQGSANGGMSRAPGAPLPTGPDWLRAQQPSQQGAASTSPNPAAPDTSVTSITQDHVDQAKQTLDTLNRRKLALFRQYPGLQNAGMGFHRLDMPFEGGGEAEVPAPAIKALAKLDSDITAAKQGYDLMRKHFGVAEQARKAAAENQAADDILRNLK